MTVVGSAARDEDAFANALAFAVAVRAWLTARLRKLVGSVSFGSVIVTPVMDAVALCVAPLTDRDVLPTPTATDGGVKLMPATLLRTPDTWASTPFSVDVSAEGTVTAPRMWTDPTFASATGAGEFADATALVVTLMLPSDASGSVL